MQHSSIPHRLQVLAVWAIASLIGLLIFNLGGLDTPQTYWSAAKPSYLQHVAFWDSEWYYRVATQGYPDSTSLPIGQDGRVGQNTWAFMPIYAYLSGGLAKLLSANYYTCAVVVAWLGSALAALGLDAWMRPRVGKAASLLGVAIFFTCGPAIILQLPYAESLGLALVAIGFAVLAKRRFAWAMVVFVLAAFTRPIGVPLGAALGLWWVWEELRARGLISASRFDASFSSARVYADADPYAANYDAAAANAAPVPNEAAIASFETAPELPLRLFLRLLVRLAPCPLVRLAPLALKPPTLPTLARKLATLKLAALKLVILPLMSLPLAPLLLLRPPPLQPAPRPPLTTTSSLITRPPPLATRRPLHQPRQLYLALRLWT